MVRRRRVATDFKRTLVTSDKVGARGRRKQFAAGSTDFRIRGTTTKKPRRTRFVIPKTRTRIGIPTKVGPIRSGKFKQPPRTIKQPPKRRPRGQRLTEEQIAQKQRQTRRRIERSGPLVRNIPVTQISSRRKPEPELIAFRPEGSREDLFSVGIGFDVGIGDNTNTFGVRSTIDAPRGTKRRLNKAFSPIAQGVIGVQNNLTDAFNSREGVLNESPIVIGIRESGRRTRNRVDNFLGEIF